MKIAILTFRLRYNYGCILQAYALQTYLERMGHEVHLLNKDVTLPITWKLLLLKIPRRIICTFFGRPMNVFLEINEKRMGRNLRPFIKNYIHSDTRLYSEIDKTDYDAFVVGSDQVWRPDNLVLRQPTLSDVFLGFAKGWNVTRLTYAVSFGTKEWTYTEEQTLLARELVKQFDAVTVRESSGIDLCREHLHIDATQLLDPTLLLKKSDYLKLIPSKHKRHKGDLMVYFLDSNDEKNKILESVIEATSLKSFSVGAKIDDLSAPIKERIQPPIEDWLQGFEDAKLIITDSFHGCVFSIIFNKPFYIIGNVNRGLARIESLLAQFEIGTNYDGYSGPYLVKYCDPSNTSKKLEELQSKSFQFFQKNLSKVQ